MCEICLRSPCSPRCPNALEPPVIYLCTGCGEEIRDGYEYYDVDGEPYCEDCVSLRTAERDDY